MSINQRLEFSDEDRTCTIPVIKDEKDFAEVMRIVHYRIATSENATVSTSAALGGKVYPVSQTAFKAAIAAAYPEADMEDVYDLWCDNMESVAYNVNYSKRRKEHEALEQAEWAKEAEEWLKDRPSHGPF